MLHTMLFLYKQPISYSGRTPILMKHMRGGNGYLCRSGMSENAVICKLVKIE